ncbi:thermonuclease family protein [Intrasporangium sp. YIM S08009]|uniref:thermonuclease family protein n=1 Tax=Intrasporangium zincisolvens TaxID=3080018 RepID=UPI002B060F07|nr:thermonuclease family protein [Intrasporangium sp. YIM S08009]
MRRRINGLVVLVGLALFAGVTGVANRSPGDLTLAGSGAGVTVTYTPGGTPPGDAPTPDAPTTVAPTTDAARRAADAKAAADKAAADRAAADKAAADQAAADQAKADQAKAAAATWAVTKVVDGDTIWVERDGRRAKVRFIGIDTPETGQCGFSEARNALRGIIGGQRVTLTAGARDDIDRYGRLLRYVDVNGVDAGLRLVKQGFAIARYDSRDGYGQHAREGAYVRADAASPKAACTPPDGSVGIVGGSGGSGGSTGSWPLPGDEHPCPQSRPVKGNENSMIAHEPGDRYYGVTDPEQCFATMDDAVAAGFRPAKV